MTTYAAGPAILGESVQHQVPRQQDEASSRYKHLLRSWIPGTLYVLDKIQYRKLFDRRPILATLPDRFVVKPTHGCGWLEIVRDKSTVDPDALRRQCADWMARNFFYVAGEWVYKNIKPRLMVEELLDDGDGGIPYDFIFFVFNGRVEFISVDLDRFGDHRRNMYDRDWNRLNFGFQRSCSDKMPAPAR